MGGTTNYTDYIKHFILVHGACHGAWCWYKIKPLLESSGHKVTVLDLAASGTNLKKIEDVDTFSQYSEPLLEVLESLPPNEKVVLVGHSLGGLNIALAMEKFPTKVAVGVFLTAFVPDTQHKPSYVLEKIDSEVGLESVKDIAAVDGVDCVMLGPLGPGLSPDKLRTAEDAVLELKASRGPGKGPHLAGFPSYRNLQEGSVELKKRGYHLVCGSTDVTLFRDAALASVNSFKSSTSGS